jgi:predicted RNA-binding Zn ribbon-like protein
MTMPPWVPADETKPAPMPSLLVQSFVNTWEGDSGIDILGQSASARDWLTETGLLRAGAKLTDEDLALARGLRESIRSLLVHNGGGPAPTAAEMAALRTVARGSWIQPAISSDGAVDLELEGSGDGLALGRLLLIIRDAQHDGTWERLKACNNSECRWAFYDRSHARRGTWCDMSVCGNRVKNRKLRSRKSSTQTSPSTESE